VIVGLVVLLALETGFTFGANSNKNNNDSVEHPTNLNK